MMEKPKIRSKSRKIPQYLEKNLRDVLKSNLSLYLGIAHDDERIRIGKIEIERLSKNFRAEVYKANVRITVGEESPTDRRVLEFILKEYKPVVVDTSGREPRENRIKQEQYALEMLRSSGRTPKPLVMHYSAIVEDGERWWIIMEYLKGNLEQEIITPRPQAISLLESLAKTGPTTRDTLKGTEFGWEDSMIEDLLGSGLAREDRVIQKVRKKVIYPDIETILLRGIERNQEGHYVISGKKTETVQDTARKVINAILSLQETITSSYGDHNLDRRLIFTEPEAYWTNIEIKLLGLAACTQESKVLEESEIEETIENLRRKVKEVYLEEIARPLAEATQREGRVIIGDCNIGNFYMDPKDQEGIVRISDLFHLRRAHPYSDIIDFLIDLKIKSGVSWEEIETLKRYAQIKLVDRTRRIYDPLQVKREFEVIETPMTFDRSVYIGGFIGWMLTKRREELTPKKIRERTRQLNECIYIAKTSAIKSQELYKVLSQELPLVFPKKEVNMP